MSSHPGAPPGWYAYSRYSIRPSKTSTDRDQSISRAATKGKTRYTAWRLNKKTDNEKYEPAPTELGTRNSLAEAMALFEAS